MFEKDLSKTHRMIFESIKKFFNISLLVPVFIFTLDRISKIYVINLSKNSSDIELFSSKFLNITLIWNEGIAFGIFSAIHGYWYNLLTIAIFLITIVILIMSIGISVPSAILDILQPGLSVPVIIGMLSYILTNVMT